MVTNSIPADFDTLWQIEIGYSNFTKKTSTHTLGQYSITIGGRVIFAKD